MTGRRSMVGCVALACGLVGCKDRVETAPISRYEAVKAPAASVARWCDDTFSSSSPRLTLPPLAAPLAGRGQAALTAGKRVWVNLWATWCGPCLREMPLLLKWQDDLRKDGVDIDVLLLSLDDDAGAVQKLLGERKDLAAAKVARVSSQSAYEEWVKTYVKDPGAPIPLHLLAGADGKMRCVRGGSLRESDYPAAKAVFR
jgi:thiol-disulfide isomerase/thioredoxin